MTLAHHDAVLIVEYGVLFAGAGLAAVVAWVRGRTPK